MRQVVGHRAALLDERQQVSLAGLVQVGIDIHDDTQLLEARAYFTVTP